MRVWVDDKQAIGKTVENFFYSAFGQMYITFTDGTFTTFDTVQDWDEYHSIANNEISLLDTENSLLVSGNIATESELEKLRKEAEEKRILKHEQTERKLYARLQEKYG